MNSLVQFDSLLSNEQIIRVFPYRTAFTPNDSLAFVGFPPFEEFRPRDRKTPVRMSVCFKWWRRDAEAMLRSWAQYYDDVKIGGPAYGETLVQAERRIERVYELGFLPFCQLYKPDDCDRTYPDDWKAVQRKWARPAAYRTRKSVPF